MEIDVHAAFPERYKESPVDSIWTFVSFVRIVAWKSIDKQQIEGGKNWILALFGTLPKRLFTNPTLRLSSSVSDTWQTLGPPAYRLFTLITIAHASVFSKEQHNDVDMTKYQITFASRWRGSGVSRPATRGWMMKKSYRYRGFVIVVESELMTTEPGTPHPDVPPGYLAIVEISFDHKPGFAASAFEVGAPSGRLFHREVEVFASGYHAATSIIDKALGPTANAVRAGRTRASARLALLAA